MADAADAVAAGEAERQKRAALMAQIDDEIAAAQKRYLALNEELRAIARNQHDWMMAEQRARDIDTLLSQLSEWHKVEQQADAQRDQRQALARASEDARAELRRLQREVETKLKSLRGEETRLQEVSKQHDALHQALAFVTSMISADDEACPVCRTKFSNGELKARAAQTFSFKDRELLAAQEAVSGLKRSLDELQGQHARLREESARIDVGIQEIDHALARQDVAWKAFQSNALLTGIGRYDAVVVVTRLAQEAHEGARVAQSRASGRADVQALRTRLQTEEDNLRGLQKGRADKVLEAQALDARMRTLGEVLEGARDIMQAWHSESDRERAILSAIQDFDKAADELRQSSERLRGVEDALRTCEARLNVAQQAADALEVEVSGHKDHVETLGKEWDALGLANEITETSVELARRVIESKQQALAAIKVSAAGLGEELGRVSAFRLLHDRAQRQVAAAGAETTEAYGQMLRSALDRELENKLRVEKCNSLIESLSVRLDGAAKKYAETVARPLERRANRFYRALSSFHQRELVLDPYVKKGERTGLRVHVALDAEGEADRNAALSAQHLFSEGQMSAASLSLALAMSTGFRWSRWPALLLDDPLQQNDVVHATSFLDVLCNLVREEKYQVVVATHDLDLADYMKRKVRAARVPCRVYRFFHPGRAEAEAVE